MRVKGNRAARFVSMTCGWCGKSMLIKAWQAAQGHGKFCSRGCMKLHFRKFPRKNTGAKPLDPVKRFWERSGKTDDPDACWNWQGGKFYDGYGQIKVNNVPTKAHRLSWNIHFGEIPEGMMVCHKCDNPSCVNPSHLFLGTAQDNMDDKHRKGRQRYIAGVWGEDHPDAKLTEENVKEIRRLKSQGAKSRELAERFEVTIVTINSVARRATWKHI